MSREESRDYLGADSPPLPPPPSPVSLQGGGAQVTLAPAGPAGRGTGPAPAVGNAPNVGSVQGAGPGATTQAKTDLDLRDLAQQYGLDYDEIQAVPELATLFRQAVQAGYSPDRFT